MRLIKKMRRLFFLLPALWGCVGEDVILDRVDPEVRITNPISNMEINTTWQFEFLSLDNVGMETTPDQVTWSTSNASVVMIDQNGLATALDRGEAIITLATTINEMEVSATVNLKVTGDTTSGSPGKRKGEIMTTTSYLLQGNFEISLDEDDLLIKFASNYLADDGLPGLYVYLTNNPDSPAGGYEIGPVQVFTGTHEYRIADIDLFDYDYLFYYCKPFKVKVGHGDIE